LECPAISHKSNFVVKKMRSKYTQNKGVCHTVALPFTLKSIFLKAKEDLLWKLKFFTIQKYNLLPKKSSKKRNQNPSRYYYNSITNNLKFQHKPKIYIIFQKSSYNKIDLLLLLLLLLIT